MFVITSFMILLNKIIKLLQYKYQAIFNILILKHRRIMIIR